MSAHEITEEISSSKRKECWHLPEKIPKKKRKEPTSEEEESRAESARSSSTMDLSIHFKDEGEEEEAEVENIPVEVQVEAEEDLAKLRSLKAQSDSDLAGHSDRPALEEKKVEKKEEKRFPLEATSKAIAKPKPEQKQKASGFAHGGYWPST